MEVIKVCLNNTKASILFLYFYSAQNNIIMSSKYIPNRGKTHSVQNNWEWSSKNADYSEVVEDNNYDEIKNRIETKSLEEVTFRDLYTFPFHQCKYSSWVYDADSNFIFQFEFKGEDTRKKVIDILNGDLLEYKRQNVEHKDGMITVDGIPFILIRGWGNLTGVGAYNLDGEYAGKIQDTLAEYIVEKLGGKE